MNLQEISTTHNLVCEVHFIKLSFIAHEDTKKKKNMTSLNDLYSIDMSYRRQNAQAALHIFLRYGFI